MNILEKTRELNKIFKRSKNIFIMGHRGLDLDALGSALGIYVLLTEERKNCHIVIEDDIHELGVNKVIQEIKGHISILKENQVIDQITDKDLLIIVDTNKLSLVQSEKIVPLFKNKLIIDHHNIIQDTISADLSIIDYDASSTCEMIAELIYYYGIKVDPYICTIILAGIVLDTNNFVVKTTAKTYFAAYELTSLGADPIKVQYLLKQDINDYIIRQKVITDLKIVNNTIAVTVGNQKVIYRKEELAKIADTLLQFNNIETSYVIGQIDNNIIGISARSIGTVNVGKKMEEFGGGGNRNEGASQIENKTLSEVEKQFIETIK